MFLILIVVTLENFLANTFYKEAPRPGTARHGRGRLTPRPGRGPARPVPNDDRREGTMIPEFSLSMTPIVPWPVLIGVIGSVTVLTLLAYRRRLHGTSGRWRWVALSLRLLAILLCLLAALRPSVMLKQKEKKQAALIFLVDGTSSMNIGDEVRGKTRWAVASETLEQARGEAKHLEPGLDARFYRFDAGIEEAKETDLTAKAEPKGRASAVGTAMLEVLKRQEQAGQKTARIILLSDFASNAGINPMVAARQMKLKGVPVVTVGLGTENAGVGSRDIILRDILAGPTVFVKNQLEVRGNAGGPRLCQPDAGRRAVRRGHTRARRPHQGEGPRRGQHRADHGAQVHPPDPRREEDHAQGRSPGG